MPILNFLNQNKEEKKDPKEMLGKFILPLASKMLEQSKDKKGE